MKSVDTAVVEISVMTALYQLMLRSRAAHVAQKNVLMSSTKKGSANDIALYFEWQLWQQNHININEIV